MPVNPEYAALEDTEFSSQLPERLFEAYHRAIFRDGNMSTKTICFSPGQNRFSALWKKVFFPKGDFENRFDWSTKRYSKAQIQQQEKLARFGVSIKENR